MQNTFSQPGNDYNFFLNHFSEKVCWTQDPPPFMEKTILNFHFDYLKTCNCIDETEVLRIKVFTSKERSRRFCPARWAWISYLVQQYVCPNLSSMDAIMCNNVFQKFLIHLNMVIVWHLFYYILNMFLLINNLKT